MGMNLGGSNSTNGRRASQPTLSEINVTPMVDVMLVLLIVFMVSAPLMQQGVQVELPRTSGQTLDEQQEPLILVITKNRGIHINKNDIAFSELRAKLDAIFHSKSSKEIFIQADQGVNYGFVAQVMAEVKRAGVTKVGLVTDPNAKSE